MLSSSLQSILDNRLRYLPEITTKAIASVDWPTKLAEVAHSYGLHMEEVEDLQSVVMRSMIGMIAPADFESSLIAALALSPSNAEKMISEINAKIFQPIHDFVMAGGKAQDGMTTSGISVQSSTDALNVAGPAQSSVSSSAEQSAGELVLPEVQKSAPIASISFEAPEADSISSVPKPPAPKTASLDPKWDVLTHPYEDTPDDGGVAEGE